MEMVREREREGPFVRWGDSPISIIFSRRIAAAGMYPTWAIRAAKKTIPSLDSFWPIL